jgi:hypothetical protein
LRVRNNPTQAPAPLETKLALAERALEDGHVGETERLMRELHRDLAGMFDALEQSERYTGEARATVEWAMADEDD